MPVRRHRSFTVAALAAAALLGGTLPAGADAKTFKAFADDDAGDSTADARDITGVRIAYNRRSGAISASLTTAAPITDSDAPAIVVFGISDLVQGKCRHIIMTAGGSLTQPGSGVFGALMRDGKQGVPRFGRGTVDDTTYSFRVRHRSFAGRTVGCMFAAIAEVDGKGAAKKILDETAYDIGFV